MNNLAMIAVLHKRYKEAREWFEKSMLLNREVGDARMVAICHNNLGNATRGLGDFEAAHALRGQPAPTATTTTSGRWRFFSRMSASSPR